MGKAENYVEQYLKDKAVEKGWWCSKFTSPGTNGVPDRVLIGHNHVFFVETKSNVGNLRPIQKAVIREMIEHGAIVHKIRTRQEVDDLLNTVKRKSDHKKLATMLTTKDLT